MFVNVPEDLMGFTVSTVSYPRSLCFHSYWLQSVQAIIIPVCSRIIASLSKEPQPWAASLTLNTPLSSHGLWDCQSSLWQGATHLLLSFPLVFSHTCKMLLFILNWYLSLSFILVLTLHSSSFLGIILCTRFRDDTQKGKHPQHPM